MFKPLILRLLENYPQWSGYFASPHRLPALLALLLTATSLTTANFAVAVTLFWIVWALSHLRQWQWPPLRSPEALLLVALLLLFTASLIGWVNNGFGSRFIDMGLRYLLLIPFFLYLLGALRINLYPLLIAGALIALCGGGLLALYEYVVLDYERTELTLGALYSALIAAALLMMVLPATTLWWRWWGFSLLCGVAGVAAMFIIFSTATKAALLVLLLLLPIYLWLERRRWLWPLQLAVVSGVALLFLLGYLTMPMVQERIDNAYYAAKQLVTAKVNEESQRLLDMSTVARLEYMKLAFMMFAEQPLTGMSQVDRIAYYQQQVDTGVIIRYRHAPEIAWGAAVIDEHWQQDPADLEVGFAHNEFLEAAAARGVMGVVALLFLYGVPLYYFSLWLSDDDPMVAAIAKSASLLVGSYLIFGLTENPLWRNRTFPFYAPLVILLWVSLRQRLFELKRGM
ncbi:MAG: O-antigen ligase family protein [Gammaproteobacteria bacterium]|nr:O-antigen ligase family protein [Gammaproteobacteria bacterium]